MNLYIALCEDRHIDPVVRVFDKLELAIAFAKQFMVDNGSDQDIEEEKIEGCIYSAQYSEEGDSVRVEQVLLNDDSVDY